MYWDTNSLYEWVMFQKLLSDNFDWKNNTSKFNERFKKYYDGNNDKRCIYEVDVEYPKELHRLHNNLLLLPEKMKIKKKCYKLVCNLYDKNVSCTHKNFKTSAKSWINTTELIL